MLNYDVDVSKKQYEINLINEFPNNFDSDSEGNKNKFIWKMFPFPIIAFIGFILLHSLTQWNYSWLVFLSIPIWGFFISKKNRYSK